MVLNSTSPKLIIWTHKPTYNHLKKIIKSLGYIPHTSVLYPTGWGHFTAEVAKYTKDGKSLSLVRFPHPSRYKIFGKEKYKDAIDKILDDATKEIFEIN